MRCVIFATCLLAFLVSVPTFAADAKFSEFSAIAAIQAEARRLAKARGPSKAACDACTDVTKAVEHFIANGTARNETETIINGICVDLFAKKGLKDLLHLCEDIPKLAFHLIAYGESSQANVPNVLCADFLHLCLQPCCTTDYTPEQLHLSYADGDPVGNATSMRVGWVTMRDPAAAIVYWRKASSSSTSSSSWSQATAVQRTYDIGNWIGVLHFAVMSNLEPGTTYTYYVESAVLNGRTFAHNVSKQYNFTTLPLDVGLASGRPIRVFGVADMGYGANAKYTIAAMKGLAARGEIDFVMHPGDIGYADADQAWWDDFFREMEPVMATTPYMTAPGNHECIWYNCTAYKKRFWMPSAGDGIPADAQFYSFNVGPVSFFMLDSETWYDTPMIGPLQTRWLEKELAAANARRQMIMVNHHRPLYCSSTSIHDCTVYAVQMRGMVEAIYLARGVSAVMCGHIHDYERTFPVFNNSVVSKSYRNPGAPAYFVNGGAGNREGQSKFYTTNNTWSAFRTLDRTYMGLHYYVNESAATAANSATREVVMHARTTQSRTGEVLDDVVLTKNV